MIGIIASISRTTLLAWDIRALWIDCSTLGPFFPDILFPVPAFEISSRRGEQVSFLLVQLADFLSLVRIFFPDIPMSPVFPWAVRPRYLFVVDRLAEIAPYFASLLGWNVEVLWRRCGSFVPFFPEIPFPVPIFDIASRLERYVLVLLVQLADYLAPVHAFFPDIPATPALPSAARPRHDVLANLVSEIGKYFGQGDDDSVLSATGHNLDFDADPLPNILEPDATEWNRLPIYWRAGNLPNNAATDWVWLRVSGKPAAPSSLSKIPAWTSAESSMMTDSVNKFAILRFSSDSQDRSAPTMLYENASGLTVQRGIVWDIRVSLAGWGDVPDTGAAGQWGDDGHSIRLWVRSLLPDRTRGPAFDLLSAPGWDGLGTSNGHRLRRVLNREFEDYYYHNESGSPMPLGEISFTLCSSDGVREVRLAIDNVRLVPRTPLPLDNANWDFQFEGSPENGNYEVHVPIGWRTNTPSQVLLAVGNSPLLGLAAFPGYKQFVALHMDQTAIWQAHANLTVDVAGLGLVNRTFRVRYDIMLQIGPESEANRAGNGVRLLFAANGGGRPPVASSLTSSQFGGLGWQVVSLYSPEVTTASSKLTPAVGLEFFSDSANGSDYLAVQRLVGFVVLSGANLAFDQDALPKADKPTATEWNMVPLGWQVRNLPSVTNYVWLRVSGGAAAQGSLSSSPAWSSTGNADSQAQGYTNKYAILRFNLDAQDREQASELFRPLGAGVLPAGTVWDARVSLAGWGAIDAAAEWGDDGHCVRVFVRYVQPDGSLGPPSDLRSDPGNANYGPRYGHRLRRVANRPFEDYYFHNESGSTAQIGEVGLALCSNGSKISWIGGVIQGGILEVRLAVDNIRFVPRSVPLADNANWGFQFDPAPDNGDYEVHVPIGWHTNTASQVLLVVANSPFMGLATVPGNKQFVALHMGGTAIWQAHANLRVGGAALGVPIGSPVRIRYDIQVQIWPEAFADRVGNGVRLLYDANGNPPTAVVSSLSSSQFGGLGWKTVSLYTPEFATKASILNPSMGIGFFSDSREDYLAVQQLSGFTVELPPPGLVLQRGAPTGVPLAITAYTSSRAGTPPDTTATLTNGVLPAASKSATGWVAWDLDASMGPAGSMDITVNLADSTEPEVQLAFYSMFGGFESVFLVRSVEVNGTLYYPASYGEETTNTAHQVDWWHITSVPYARSITIRFNGMVHGSAWWVFLGELRVTVPLVRVRERPNLAFDQDQLPTGQVQQQIVPWDWSAEAGTTSHLVRSGFSIAPTSPLGDLLPAKGLWSSPYAPSQQVGLTNNFAVLVPSPGSGSAQLSTRVPLLVPTTYYDVVVSLYVHRADQLHGVRLLVRGQDFYVSGAQGSLAVYNKGGFEDYHFRNVVGTLPVVYEPGWGDYNPLTFLFTPSAGSNMALAIDNIRLQPRATGPKDPLSADNLLFNIDSVENGNYEVHTPSGWVAKPINSCLLCVPSAALFGDNPPCQYSKPKAHYVVMRGPSTLTTRSPSLIECTRGESFGKGEPIKIRYTLAVWVFPDGKRSVNDLNGLRIFWRDGDWEDWQAGDSKTSLQWAQDSGGFPPDTIPDAAGGFLSVTLTTPWFTWRDVAEWELALEFFSDNVLDHCVIAEFQNQTLVRQLW